MANEAAKLSENEVVKLGELFKGGRVPLKLVTGNGQVSGPVFVMPGAVHAAENAVVIFVCG